MKNVKVSKNIKKLIAGIVLVDSLITGLFISGKHTPIKLDDTEQYFTKEIHMINDEKEETSFYTGKNDFNQNYILYYKKPFEKDGKIVREVIKVSGNNTLDKKSDSYFIACDNLDEEEYTESVIYEKDLDNYIIVKQSVKDEIKDDIILLALLSSISISIYTIGKSIIDREEKAKK